MQEKNAPSYLKRNKEKKNVEKINLKKNVCFIFQIVPKMVLFKKKS